MPKEKSLVWDESFFTKVVINDVVKAACQICGTKMSLEAGGGTSSLRRHLKARHRATYESDFLPKQKKRDEDKKVRAEQKTAREKMKDVKKSHQTRIQFVKKNTMSISDPRSSKLIDIDLAEMIAQNDLPFSIVENLGFMRFINRNIPDYKLKSRKFYKELLIVQYAKLKQTVKQEIGSACDNISLTTDIWSNSVEALFSLTAHFIGKDFKRHKFILHAQQMESEKHTGHNLCSVLIAMLENWDIPRTAIHIILRDSGANIVKALKYGSFENASCATHLLNLVVGKALNEQSGVVSLISSSRKLMGLFHRSNVARKQLKEIQERRGFPKLSLIQDCPTRWNSTYDMLARLHETKDALSIFLCEYDGGSDTDVHIINWSLIPMVLEVLKPFAVATENLSHSEASLADVIPNIKWLKNVLNEMESTSDIGTIVACLKEELNRRFDILEWNKYYCVATMLDPRYKKYFFSDSTSVYAIEKIEEIASSNITEEIAPASKKIRIEKKESACGNWDEFMAEASMNSTSDESIVEASGRIGINYEIQKYLKAERLGIEENPLLWWKENANAFPILAGIARQFLSAPATTVSSEQLFSGAGIIYEPLRNRLSGEITEKLLFMKYNLPIVQFSY